MVSVPAGAILFAVVLAGCGSTFHAGELSESDRIGVWTRIYAPSLRRSVGVYAVSPLHFVEYLHGSSSGEEKRRWARAVEEIRSAGVGTQFHERFVSRIGQSTDRPTGALDTGKVVRSKTEGGAAGVDALAMARSQGFTVLAELWVRPSFVVVADRRLRYVWARARLTRVADGETLWEEDAESYYGPGADPARPWDQVVDEVIDVLTGYIRR